MRKLAFARREINAFIQVEVSYCAASAILIVLMISPRHYVFELKGHLEKAELGVLSHFFV